MHQLPKYILLFTHHWQGNGKRWQLHLLCKIICPMSYFSRICFPICPYSFVFSNFVPILLLAIRFKDRIWNIPSHQINYHRTCNFWASCSSNTYVISPFHLSWSSSATTGGGVLKILLRVATGFKFEQGSATSKHTVCFCFLVCRMQRLHWGLSLLALSSYSFFSSAETGKQLFRNSGILTPTKPKLKPTVQHGGGRGLWSQMYPRNYWILLQKEGKSVFFSSM